MKRIREAGFRELYQKFVYIDCIDLIRQYLPDEIAESDDGVLAYGYVDENEGICFLPVRLVTARADGKFGVRHFKNEDHEIVLTAKQLQDNNVANISGIENEKLKAFANEIDEIVAEKAPALAALREKEALDPFRHPYLADQVRVLFLNDERKFVPMYVKPVEEDGEHLYGIPVKEEASEGDTEERVELLFYEDENNHFLYALEHEHAAAELSAEESEETESAEEEPAKECPHHHEEEDEQDAPTGTMEDLKELVHTICTASTEEKEGLNGKLYDLLTELSNAYVQVETTFASVDGEASLEDREMLLKGNMAELSDTILPGVLNFNNNSGSYLALYTSEDENRQVTEEEYLYRAHMDFGLFLHLGGYLESIDGIIIDPYSDALVLEQTVIKEILERAYTETEVKDI